MPRISAARASAQRERILDAALTCFAREGFHAATMQDIVAESGLSPGAIYGYFKGKTEVVMAIASERHAMERRRMEDALAAADLDTSLARLIEGFVLGLRDPQEKKWRRLAVQLWAESLSNPRLKREALAGVSQAVEILSPMIAQAQRRGTVAASSRSAFGGPRHGCRSAGDLAATGLGRLVDIEALPPRCGS